MKQFLRTVMTALALAGLAAPGLAEPQADGRIPLRSTTVKLNAEAPDELDVGALHYLGGVELSSADERFGGFSGLLLSADGKRLSAVSDRGYWLQADVFHNADDSLVGVANARMGRLKGLDGKPMSASRHTDAEGLTVLPNGDWLVSFERQHRFRRYPAGAQPLAATPTDLPKPPGIDSAPYNGGMEALVTVADGGVLVLTEELLEGDDRVAFLWQGGAWSRLTLERHGQFKPTGAARLPDGDVVLLERLFSPIGGLAIRVSRIAAESIAPGARLNSQQLAVLRPPLAIDNMEGIHAREGRHGRTLIYIISDDNYKPILQDTLLLLFALEE
ncbi:MAG: esterase-like activity of phytase family protein [Rhodovibrionaceae bacterium]|nr:esterase-like activity of phytase family protein [Rhodovibrionaceae bacterium]